jgi:hypothetical protein
MFFGGYASAHQFTPTYPKFKISHVPELVRLDMKLFNKRSDINYYTFGVYDEDWKKVVFAVPKKVIRVEHLDTVDVKIYVRRREAHKVKYVCSKSKILKEGGNRTPVASRICSKIK